MQICDLNYAIGAPTEAKDPVCLKQFAGIWRTQCPRLLLEKNMKD